MKGLIKGAIVIAFGGFIAKLLGAVYRVPLTNLLKSEGLGLYQMVFPVYCILLDFAGGGVPCGLSKLISSEQDQIKKAMLIKNAVLLLAITGLIGSILMFLLSGVFATAQGNPLAKTGYMFLAPSVALVSVLSCYRGFFQGENQMSPTAISQVIEQVVKLIFGLIFVSLLMPKVPLAVGGATFAVTISETVALIYLFAKYKRATRSLGKIPFEKVSLKSDAKRLIKICLPITLTGILIPFSQTIDSFLIINILAKYMQNATSVYGLLSGAVMSVVNLPVSVCYGLAVAVLPLVSGDKNGGKKHSDKAIMLTLLLSIFMTVGVYFFADFIVNLLFSGLPSSEKLTVIALLKSTCPVVITLSLLQTLNSVLVAKGKSVVPLINLSVGILIKTLLSIVLLKNQSLNIFGSVISLNACYFVATFLNLVYYFIDNNKRKSSNDTKERFTPRNQNDSQ